MNKGLEILMPYLIKYYSSEVKKDRFFVVKKLSTPFYMILYCFDLLDKRKKIKLDKKKFLYSAILNTFLPYFTIDKKAHYINIAQAKQNIYFDIQKNKKVGRFNAFKTDILNFDETRDSIVDYFFKVGEYHVSLNIDDVISHLNSISVQEALSLEEETFKFPHLFKINTSISKPEKLGFNYNDFGKEIAESVVYYLLIHSYIKTNNLPIEFKVFNTILDILFDANNNKIEKNKTELIFDEYYKENHITHQQFTKHITKTYNSLFGDDILTKSMKQIYYLGNQSVFNKDTKVNLDMERSITSMKGVALKSRDKIFGFIPNPNPWPKLQTFFTSDFRKKIMEDLVRTINLIKMESV